MRNDLDQPVVSGGEKTDVAVDGDDAAKIHGQVAKALQAELDQVPFPAGDRHGFGVSRRYVREARKLASCPAGRSSTGPGPAEDDCHERSHCGVEHGHDEQKRADSPHDPEKR